jgi:hypothetical protein
MPKTKVFSSVGSKMSLGRILSFDQELLEIDHTKPQIQKSEVKMDYDYMILKGDHSGRIARCASNKEIKLYGTFKNVRSTQVRVKIEKGWGCVPVVGPWQEGIDVYEPNFDRPPILLIQSRSIVGAPLSDEVQIVIREAADLVGQFTYKTSITPETLDLPRLEETLYDLASHKKTHPSLRDIDQTGYYVCYENDGWLLKCSPFGRLRFVRRSHLISVTICRCGRDLMDAMFDDVTLRMLLPCRAFVGKVGVKMDEFIKAARARRSSSIIGADSLGFDLAELLDDFDHSASYKRMFQRRLAVTGNFLAQDTQFMDAIRAWIDNGGLARRAIVPNVVKWRHMIKSAAAGDDPYLLFEDVRIVGSQWIECLDGLPNSKFKPYSFSCVYYNATVRIDSAKLAHKAMHVVKPKADIAKVFERQILMNGAYFVVAVSRKDVSDDKLHVLLNNLERFVNKVAKTHAYKTKRIAMGIHYENMLFMDFRVYRRFTRSILDYSTMYADDERYDPLKDPDDYWYEEEDDYRYDYDDAADKKDSRWIYA